MLQKNIENKEGKLEPETVTPEEKLFRVISAANRNDADFQELLEKFVKVSQEKNRSRAGVKLTECWNAGTSVIENSGIQVLDFLRRRPRWMAFFILGAVAVTCWNFSGVLRSEKTFYFYGAQPLPEKAEAEKVKLEKSDGEQAALQPDPEPYKLVGISWDGQTRVAMIESSADGRARFAKAGDILSGDTKVLDIKDYSVTLYSGRRQWELT